MVKFTKMHGCGNDFIVLDGRRTSLPAFNWVKLADRRFGIGCDQIIILQPSDKADLFMRIINSDGSEVAACGNATRCVGWLLASETKQKNVFIETFSGILSAKIVGNQVTVDMGEPRLSWSDIPLSQELDTLHMPLMEGMEVQPVCVSMGNPHVVFFVRDAESVPLEKVGPRLENHKLFPQKVNVGVAQVITENAIKLRVWERGGGMPFSCGTGACAAVVAGHLRGHLQGVVEVAAAGGTLLIEWDRKINRVFMTGPTQVSFKGELTDADFA